MGNYERQEAWNAEHTVQVKLKLNKNTDADILTALEACGNRQGYIKELIRKDIKNREA